ncbi:MAG: alpha/beta hydrolase [Solirubrobacteraceae bacterium]
MELQARQRPADGDPAGLLVLHHGRGADEHDLLGLGDVLDPERRLHVVTPRAPLTVPGWPGHHWYLVERVGFPDPGSFHAARAALAAFHDELWEHTGLTPERTVLGGFSMGSVMSYAMAFDPARPAVAGVLAFSGFVPTVEDWGPDLAARAATRAFVAHGRRDPAISVAFARRARELLEAAGIAVEYRESDAAHQIDPADVEPATAWLRATLAP